MTDQKTKALEALDKISNRFVTKESPGAFVFVNEWIETIRKALTEPVMTPETKMVNVPYDDGTPSREWVEENGGDDALMEAVEDGMPCVSCGKPSHRQTPDDADMCNECFGDFNAIEYDLIKSEKQKLEERIKELSDESMRFRIEVINLKDLLKRASPYLGYTSAGMKIQAEIETLKSNQSPPDHKLVADAHRGNMKGDVAEVTRTELTNLLGGGAAKTLCYAYPSGIKIINGGE